MNGLIVTRRIGRSGRAAVQLGCDGVGDVLDLLEFLLEVITGSRLTLRVDPIGSLLDGIQERLLIISVQLATEALGVTKLGFEAVDIGREGVESFDALLLGFVIGSELLSLGDHTVNLLLTETSPLVGDRDRLGLASALISGGDFHDTVGVDFERNLDLGNATWSGRDASELELAKEVVVLGEGAFTLVDFDQDGGLVVGSGGENLALAGGDDGVPGDEFGHDTASGLDTESEGIDVDKDDVLQALVVGEDTTLNGSTIGNSLIGVNPLGGLLPEVLLEELLNLGDTSRTTDENDLRDTLVGFATTDC